MRGAPTKVHFPPGLRAIPKLPHSPMRWIILALAMGGLAVGLVRKHSSAPALQAGTAIRMEVEDLVDRADFILEARITGRRTLQDEHGRIVTEYQLLKRREFYGESGDVVRIPGGVLASGRGLILPGMPLIQVGEEVMLFLNGDNLSMTTGLAQGKYRLMTTHQGERLAVRQGGLEVAGSGCGHASHSNTAHLCQQGAVQAMPYAELSARVQARVADRLAQEAFVPSQER